ncbi:unnamed protein product [Meganyctiphanes norvegica]|uniref:Uncharacterized protein n=1 Tax=Meganyctiphanes norvegica TaxID=48144 RepID=A0AAV2RUK6_MEGNR
MASPFPFVRTNTKMGSMRYSVPTGITKFHSFANSLANHPTSLGSYSVPRTTQGSHRDSTYYPHINLRSCRAASEMPFISPSRSLRAASEMPFISRSRHSSVSRFRGPTSMV